MIRTLYGFNDKFEPPKKPITPLEEYLGTLLFNYGELDESLKRFKIISVLIQQYPRLKSWDRVGLNKTVYLRYHYETFLNETYIYRERMCLFLNVLKKRCRKISLSDEAHYVEDVLQGFLKSLEDVTNIRGRHVHVRRYSNSKMEQLMGLEMVLEFSEDLEKLRDKEYRDLRTKLGNEVEKFGADLENLQNLTLSKVLKVALSDLKDKYK